MRVLKIGGNELNEPDFLPALAGWVAETTDAGEAVVIVHGGGSDIATMQARLGLEPKKVDGLRITDADSLAVAQMVLSGQTNKQIVASLLAVGVDAVGLSGVDGRLLTATKKLHSTVDLGLVGDVYKRQILKWRYVSLPLSPLPDKRWPIFTPRRHISL